MKLKKYIVLPAVLLIYLAVMAYIGYGGIQTGQTSWLQYLATLIASLGVIVLLFFFLRKRDRLRREREADIENAQKPEKQEDK